MIAGRPRFRITGALLFAALLAAATGAASELAKSLPPLEGDSFCFFVWSDTHFDGRDHAGLRDDAVNDMNRLAGQHLVAGYGVCEPVAFVIHTGDITTNARDDMWKNENGHTDDDFLSCAGRLDYPVFECLGNHDADGGRTCVVDAVTERHGGTSYSFDYGGIHFVGLGLTNGAPKPDSEELAWLKQDLSAVNKSTPVILWEHFPLEDQPAWDAFHQAISEHNVVLILHGHTHQHKRYKWRGIDVWDAGHNDGRVNSWSSDPKTISAIRIEGNRLRAVHYITTQDTWETTYMLDKPIR
jgi:predicted phosphodiesterase